MLGLFGLGALWAAGDRPPPSAQGLPSPSLLQKEDKKDEGPIHIVSDRMVADNKNQWVHFIGSVTSTRGDLIIHSDRLEVYRDPKTQRIERIEAIGRVDISRAGRYATAEKAIYYETEEKIALLGNPKAWENDNIIVGHKMTFFLKTDQLIVEGSPNRRVDVVLYPKKEKERDQRGSPADRKKTAAPQAPGSGDGKGPSETERAARDPGARQVVPEPPGRR